MKKISYLLLCIFFILLLIIIIHIVNIKQINMLYISKMIDINNKTNNYSIEELKEEYNNDNIIGILSLDNTSFTSIIVQYTDNEYYQDHNIFNKKDWRGQTFLDYRNDINTSKKLIIYGHNSNYYDLPFKIFENYYSDFYYQEHKYIYIKTDTKIYKYLIFSVYVEVSDFEYYNTVVFNNSLDYYNHILSLKNKSLYDTGVSIDINDNILIIQTCSTKEEYSSYEDKFLLIIAKEVS